MNIVLWVVQAALAVKLLSVTFTHGIRPDATKMQRGTDRFGKAARPLLLLVALGASLGAVLLLLPAAIGTLAWLTPWVAAALALVFLASITFHVACREQPKIWASLILCALAAFVAYGRWA